MNAHVEEPNEDQGVQTRCVQEISVGEGEDREEPRSQAGE
jgi:hypothetical protein